MRRLLECGENRILEMASRIGFLNLKGIASMAAGSSHAILGGLSLNPPNSDKLDSEELAMVTPDGFTLLPFRCPPHFF